MAPITNRRQQWELQNCGKVKYFLNTKDHKVSAGSEYKYNFKMKNHEKSFPFNDHFCDLINHIFTSLRTNEKKVAKTGPQRTPSR